MNIICFPEGLKQHLQNNREVSHIQKFNLICCFVLMLLPQKVSNKPFDDKSARPNFINEITLTFNFIKLLELILNYL